jgi:hypothetical protein
MTEQLFNFMRFFYATSDDPTAHEEYTRYFTKDATLIMGGKRADGYDGMHPYPAPLNILTDLLTSIEILALRKGLWTSVAARKHNVSGMYHNGTMDMMIYGTVAYVMKGSDGTEVVLDWAARAEYTIDRTDPSNPGFKMTYYQVYLVCPFIHSFTRFPMYAC